MSASTHVKAQMKHKELVMAELENKNTHAKGVAYASGGFND